MKRDEMNLLKRAIRLFLFVATMVAATMVGMALFLFRQMIRPERQPIWATPLDAGMPFEDIEFPARDGLRLSGWFIPAQGTSKGTVVLVHGWTWNRLGEGADHLLANMVGGRPVDLLRMAHALHTAGYAVLSYDTRNHGLSAGNSGVTFGMKEAEDLLGAMDYLLGREDVDPAKLAAVGFSMGGNTVLYGLARTGLFQAAVAVQPVSPEFFGNRFAQDVLGPFGQPILRLAETFYQQSVGTPIGAIEPLFAAAGAGDTPVLYIQGEGDRWGGVSNVAHMASVTPHATGPLLVPSEERYGGYRYAVSHPELIIDFLDKQLADD
jgi:pimeloyl-ACP methyl ester carboxylesterase